MIQLLSLKDLSLSSMALVALVALLDTNVLQNRWHTIELQRDTTQSQAYKLKIGQTFDTNAEASTTLGDFTLGLGQAYFRLNVFLLQVTTKLELA